MKIEFYKYQGTGNDFVILDNRRRKIQLGRKSIQQLCDRKFGIGADGLMYLQKGRPGYDFEMVYFNADGRKSSFCGNGSRCIVALARVLGVLRRPDARFLAADGPHHAICHGTRIRIRMRDVQKIQKKSGAWILNTGSPHYVRFVKNAGGIDLISRARTIRYSARFRKTGINVNLAQRSGDSIFLRTYERGVENETLSCGTGVTATALVASLKGWSTGPGLCKVRTPGGNLIVRFKKTGSGFRDIWLEGPAQKVYQGEINL